MALSFCYVTTGSRKEALAIGRAVVGERLAACANVLDGITSIYWWQGALEQASEAVRDVWRSLEEFQLNSSLALEALFVRLRRALSGRA